MIVFFDTNILVYCTDRKDLKKQAKARALVEQHGTDGFAVISTQVLIELYNVLVNKQRVPRNLAGQLIEGYAQWKVVQSDVALVRNAVALTIAHTISIWDAMVVEAALVAGASTLFSEDLSHGTDYGHVTLVNPFA